MAAWQRALLATFLLLALAQLSGVQDGLNRRIGDVHAQWRASGQRVPFPSDLVVVAIDDRSVTQLGRVKYWSRARYGELLARLSQAKVVGFDILFTEPDRDPSGDRAFAAAMRRHGRVVVPFYQWKETRPVSAETQRQERALLERVAVSPRAGGLETVQPSTLEPPIPELLASAAALGFADVNADPDGVYRAPTLLKALPDGTPLPQFTVAIAALAAGSGPDGALKGAPAELSFGGRRVPLEGGSIRLRALARRGGGFLSGAGEATPTISFVDALTAKPEEFRDKIVVVGETATGTTDIRPNPLDNGLRGVELNLEMLANLLHLDPPRPVPLWMQWLLILLAAGLPLWLYTALPPARATAGSLAVLGGVIAALEGGFWLGNLNTPYQASAPLVAVVGATLAMGVMRAAAEHAQKQKFRERFSQYVSPKLIAQIERNPDLTAEEGKRQRIAVLFSDVRGFTTYSEYNPPELVVRQMREYLDEMAAAVDQFDGVLDKFIGDAVMALYGPFMEQPDKRNLSALAVASALNMLQRLERVNARWGEEGLPLFRIGIGIHVGDAMVGEIGTPRRQQLTALGDTVNLAARLESSTKDLQATIIVSDAVRQEAEPVLREVATFTERGAISVKGREQPVRVFEVRPVTAAGLAPPVHH